MKMNSQPVLVFISNDDQDVREAIEVAVEAQGSRFYFIQEEENAMQTASASSYESKGVFVLK